MYKTTYNHAYETAILPQLCYASIYEHNNKWLCIIMKFAIPSSSNTKASIVVIVAAGKSYTPTTITATTIKTEVITIGGNAVIIVDMGG